jgi:hypothetical protein
MSIDQIPFAGAPEPSVEARMRGLDDKYLELLCGQQSAYAPFDNGFDNAFDNAFDNSIN